jgi:pimeloyl-ACP methyl ester carboxylesterase
VDYLEKLNIPILWLYGDAALDRFCPVELSITRLNELIIKGKDYEIISEPGANHSLQLKNKDLAIQKAVFDWLLSRL